MYYFTIAGLNEIGEGLKSWALGDGEDGLGRRDQRRNDLRPLRVCPSRGKAFKVHLYMGHWYTYIKL